MELQHLAEVSRNEAIVFGHRLIAGALTWGVIWASSNAVLQRSLEGAAKRWWTIFVDLATGALMLAFAVSSAQRLMAG